MLEFFAFEAFRLQLFSVAQELKTRAAEIPFNCCNVHAYIYHVVPQKSMLWQTVSGNGQPNCKGTWRQAQSGELGSSENREMYQHREKKSLLKFGSPKNIGNQSVFLLIWVETFLISRRKWSQVWFSRWKHFKIEIKVFSILGS